METTPKIENSTTTGNLNNLENLAILEIRESSSVWEALETPDGWELLTQNGQVAKKIYKEGTIPVPGNSKLIGIFCVLFLLFV